jgi:hypothetical protein
MKVATKGDAFFIYDLPSPNDEPHPHEIPSQYQELKDVSEKKNAGTLPKHRPYDYTIDLLERVQPPFGPICNLSQEELVAFC